MPLPHRRPSLSSSVKPGPLARSPLGRALATALLAASLPGTAARAADVVDEGFALERLRPATTAAGVNDVEWAAVGEDGQWNTALWLHYASDPLAVYDDGDRLGALVAHRTAADLSASVALFGRLELAVQLPVVLFQTADTTGLPAAVSGFTTAATGAGDLRVAPKVGLLRAAAHGVDLAVTPAFTLPTALPAERAWLGEGTPTFVPELAVSRDLGALRVATNVAYRTRSGERALRNLTVGPEVIYRAGVGVRLHELVALPVIVDASLAGATRAAAPFVSGAGDNPLEALLSLRHDLLYVPRARGAGHAAVVQGFVGGGAGLVGGTGTPDFRVFAGVRVFAPGDVDADDDGVVDASDACASEAEDEDGHADADGCPDADNDGDGTNDAVDRCPNEPEDNDRHEDADGCPDVDNDGDGVRDADDRCPDAAGPVEAQGCKAG